MGARTSRALGLVGLLTAALAMGGCAHRPLPERESYAGQLYVKRCGGCHEPYHPGTMTPAMWEVEVEMMNARMAQVGVAPLRDGERETILGYLRRNSGSQ